MGNGYKAAQNARANTEPIGFAPRRTRMIRSHIERTTHRRRIMQAAGVAACLVLLLVGPGSWGCGRNGDTGDVTSTSAAAGSTSATGSQQGETTLPPPADQTTLTVTTVVTGTTMIGSETRALTFLGPVSQETWAGLRRIVMDAADDGQKVLDGVAVLSVGPPVDVPTAELDAISGIGVTAGASTSQPIGVAVDSSGNQLMVFSYTVTGHPEQTTIVGFQRDTNSVILVEGPLPISDSTENITTVPSP
jgi:hypothetical protein